MVELEETFIRQLQRVADTYKREMQEQHSLRSDTEARLRAVQLALHRADAQKEDAQAALHALQVLLLLLLLLSSLIGDEVTQSSTRKSIAPDAPIHCMATAITLAASVLHHQVIGALGLIHTLTPS